MRSSILRHAIGTAALTVAALAATAPAAGAHGATGQPIPDAKHYLAQIERLVPAVPGVTAKVDPRGEWIEVTNTTSKTLTILGYAHEPYLQITSVGVQQNDLSVSAQLNQSLFGDLSQLGLDSQLPAAWRTTATTNHVRWHDHRIHWMSPQRPPAVQAHPDRAQLIGHWTVHMSLAGRPVDLTGTLSWLPVKPATNWLGTWMLAVDSAVFAAAVGAGAWFLRRARKRAPTPSPDGPATDSYYEAVIAGPPRER